jgi:hypothetical protein
MTTHTHTPGFRETTEQREEEVPVRHLHGRKRGPSPPPEGTGLLGRRHLARSDVQGLGTEQDRDGMLPFSSLLDSSLWWCWASSVFCTVGALFIAVVDLTVPVS